MLLPVFVFLEHSTAFSTWMSRGLSSADAEPSNSATAAVMVENRMMSDFCGIRYVVENRGCLHIQEARSSS